MDNNAISHNGTLPYPTKQTMNSYFVDYCKQQGRILSVVDFDLLSDYSEYLIKKCTTVSIPRME